MSGLGALLTDLYQVLVAAVTSPLVQSLLRALSLVPVLLNTGWPDNYIVKDGDTCDFLVIGAGSAGAIVASRLAEDPLKKVLLIEFGGDPSASQVIPGLFVAASTPEYDYPYNASMGTGNGKARGSEYLTVHGGKVLGGSSSTNFLIYCRGNAGDFNRWNETAPGWAWKDVLPFFKKSENMTDPSVLQTPQNAELHSTEGPVDISRPDDNALYKEVNDIRIDAYRQIGIRSILETNGNESLGATRPHFTFGVNGRSSTGEAYLKHTEKKPNLLVAKYTRVTKILIDPVSLQAYGAEMININGVKVTVFARLEVIVCAGAFGSPKLLMLSGIGPSEELTKHGITPIADLPVGQGLKDHLFVPIPFAGKQGLGSTLNNLLVPTQLAVYPVPVQTCLYRRDGLSDDQPDRPLFQTFNIYVGATATVLLNYGCKGMGYTDAFCSSLAKHNLYREVDVTAVLLLHPKSEGYVRLRSSDPLDDPLIHLNYFSVRDDLVSMIKGIKYIREVENTTYYRRVSGYSPQLDVPGCEGILWDSDEYWECYLRSTVGSIDHYVGTCKMGPRGLGVVNERLKVHGVGKLRVADASIMPETVSCNTNAAAMMIGEKLSHMVKEDHGMLP